MNKNLHSQVNNIFFKILAEEKESEKIKELFSDIYDPEQMVELAQRVACVLYLDKGRGEDNIADNLKMTKKEIDKVRKKMGNPGMQYLIQHAKAEEFAQEWSAKILKLIKIVIP